MINTHSLDDLLGFLDHAASRGLMPAATAQALAVASRNVLGVLTEDEKADLSGLNIDKAIKRFENKRAGDFNPSSLKAYGSRVRRAVALFLEWRKDPARFTVKTRASRASRNRRSDLAADQQPTPTTQVQVALPQVEGTYQSSFPVRPGVVVTLSNVPANLTGAEADRLANFIKLLVIE